MMHPKPYSIYLRGTMTLNLLPDGTGIPSLPADDIGSNPLNFTQCIALTTSFFLAIVGVGGAVVV